MNWVISDVHGCVYTLEKLLTKLRTADQNPQFIFVGDYCDRGLHSKEVVSLLINLQKDGATCLRGNHDDVISYLVNDHAICDFRHFINNPHKERVVVWWSHHGLLNTLQSYGISDSSIGAIAEKFPLMMPEDHKEFFRNLQVYWENETHFSCHAFVRYDEELPRDFKFMPNDRNVEALWNRFPSDRHGTLDTERIKTKWDRIGVFGHTPVTVFGSYVPIRHDKIRLIDTGAFTDNYLAAYCCETDDWILQATDSRDIR